MKLEQRNGGQTVDTEAFPETKWIIAILLGMLAYLVAEAIGLTKP
jgi:hypothetical protein